MTRNGGALDTAQLALPLGPLITIDHDDTLTIQQRFEAFHTLNPWVLDALTTLARDYVRQGHHRVGVGMLFEVLRWQYGRTTHGDPFKLNNDYRSRYVRLIVDQHPELADAFETRALRAS